MLLYWRRLLWGLISFYVIPLYADTTTASSPAAASGAPPVASSSQNAPVSTLTADQVLQNIADQLPSLMRLVTAIAYVIGMYLIFVGITKFKHMGEMRTQMSHEHSVRAPLILLVTGGFLLYLPTSVQVGLSTFWSMPSPYGYLERTDQWSSVINNCFLVLQLFGTIAFVRGLIILSHLSSQGGHQNSFGKGVTHIIGGLLCINIYQFVQLIMTTLGVRV